MLHALTTHRTKNRDTLGHCQGTYPVRARARSSEGETTLRSLFAPIGLTQASLLPALCSPRGALCLSLSIRLSRRRYRDRCTARDACHSVQRAGRAIPQPKDEMPRSIELTNCRYNDSFMMSVLMQVDDDKTAMIRLLLLLWAVADKRWQCYYIRAH